MTTTLKLQSNSLFDYYIDFKKNASFESLKGYEGDISSTSNILSTSTEAFATNEGTVKKVILSIIAFVSKIIGVISKIISSVVDFFKKLLYSAMDEGLIRKYGEFYNTHKESVLDSYNRYADKVYVTGIPPKNSNSFNSDNKIAMSVQRTLNALEEIDVTFKQRVNMWDRYNKKHDDEASKGFFQELLNRIDLAKTHIKDTALLAHQGLRIPYDLDAICLYDPQVRLYLKGEISKDYSEPEAFLLRVLAIPRVVISIYLFGKEDVASESSTPRLVSEFLAKTGPKEFDKLNYSDMKRIRGNMVVIDGLIKKMETVANRLKVSGDAFCSSLQKNPVFFLSLQSEGTDDASWQDIFKSVILPLLNLSSHFFSYFSNLIIDYSMFYVRHRKALFEAARDMITMYRKETASSSEYE